MRSAALAAAIAMSMSQIPALSASRTQARSMVITRQGIVATSQTLASQAGAQVLARGGSAVDAAIAANAVMGVVEPMSNGMGGDLFAIYWDAKSGKLTGINASGWSPKGLSIDFLEGKQITAMPQEGIHSVTVPGCVDGWEKLHKRFGRLPWADLFQPAIYYAKNGFPVTELISEAWRASLVKLSRDVTGRAVFLPDGEAPRMGAIFKNPDLARALELVAKGGAPAFYKGVIAKNTVEMAEWLGGTLTEADFAEYQSEWVTPISTDYRGWKVYELPPNGQGVAALAMLNIMETFALPKLGPLTAEAWHSKIEAQKLAYQDLARYVADPRFAQHPAGRHARQEVRRRAGRPHRPRARQVRRRRGQSSRRSRRHNLSVRGR